MKKSELKTGHLLEFNNESKRGLVLRNNAINNDIIVYRNGFDYMSYMNENLIYNTNLDVVRKVMRVYSTSGWGAGTEGILEFHKDSHNTELIWERKPSIDIDVRINGKDAKLSDLSEETLLQLRKDN